MEPKENYIKSTGVLAYAIKTTNGYELWSNDRKLHIVIEKRTVFNPFNNTQQDVYTTVCWMLYIGGWERGDNSVNVNSIGEYIHELDASPYFTNAVREYRTQNNITE